jgi:hypothetical protein
MLQMLLAAMSCVPATLPPDGCVAPIPAVRKRWIFSDLAKGGLFVTWNSSVILQTLLARRSGVRRFIFFSYTYASQYARARKQHLQHLTAMASAVDRRSDDVTGPIGLRFLNIGMFSRNYMADGFCSSSRLTLEAWRP